MAEFDIEDMRFLPSPFEVLEEARLSRDKLMRARITDPKDEHYSVLAYDYMWNGEGLQIDPVESARLKVVAFALGERSCDLTVALILPEEDRQQAADYMREMRRSSEQQALEFKKSSARIAIIHQAELTEDALELIKTEVMTEHPELYFPEDKNPQE